MLSAMTTTVTVAPLTISTGSSAPAAGESRMGDLPTKLRMTPSILETGMPTRTIGSWCSTSFAPTIFPSLSMPMAISIGLPE